MKRRTFLSTTAMAVAGAAVVGCGKPTESAKKAYGLQLYTLRDVIKDTTKVKDTVKQLVDWGYNEFEAYGYSNGQMFGMPYKEFTDYVRTLGARVTSAHYDIDVIRTQWDQAVADAKEAGQEYMVLPWIDEANRTPDGFKQIIEDVNKAAEVTKKAGIRMGYHNHDFEFKMIGDKTGFDTLLEGFDKDLVSWELDLYWVVRAGQDPEQIFMKYPGRFEQWHIKDMDKADPTKNADVGTGSIDFKKLLMHAHHAGLKHWYVEQETYPVDPMTSTKNSIDYLKTI
ncbi:MAG: sugar phosphate isomerase/epimerase [Bacteroidota bacterium]